MTRPIHTDVAETTLGITGSDVVANVNADALADKFFTTVYSNGDMDLLGTSVHTYHTNGIIHADLMPLHGMTLQQFRMYRSHAIELRDALDVLLRATSKGVAE